jgi:hypothetical protein
MFQFIVGFPLKKTIAQFGASFVAISYLIVLASFKNAIMFLQYAASFDNLHTKLVVFVIFSRKCSRSSNDAPSCCAFRGISESIQICGNY